MPQGWTPVTEDAQAAGWTPVQETPSGGFWQGVYNKLPPLSDLPEGIGYILGHPIDSANLVLDSMRPVSVEDYVARHDAHAANTSPMERLGENASVLGQLALGAKAPAIVEGAVNASRRAVGTAGRIVSAVDPVDAVGMISPRTASAMRTAQSVREAMQTPDAPTEIPAGPGILGRARQMATAEPPAPTPTETPQAAPTSSPKMPGMSAKDYVRLRQSGMSDEQIAQGWAEYQASKPAAPAAPETPVEPTSPTDAIKARIKQKLTAAELAKRLREEYGSEEASRMLYGRSRAGALSRGEAVDAIKRLAPGASKLPNAAKRAIDAGVQQGTPADVLDYVNAAPNDLVREYFANKVRSK